LIKEEYTQLLLAHQIRGITTIGVIYKLWPIKMTDMEKYSTINIRETKESKTVKITSNLKPDIDSSITEKWQSLIDTLAKIVNVPSGLIMRLN